MKKYSAKQLANHAGVTVRTLHVYDKIGLLTPAIRTEAKYRYYGENEVLKLQQILFYKELDFSLKEIMAILNHPDFDKIEALENHKKALQLKQKKIDSMLITIEKTVFNIKNKSMITLEDLYSGFNSKDSKNYRNEAIEKYGKDQVEQSENYLKKLSKSEIEFLKNEQKEIFNSLFKLVKENPESDRVQFQIARHYANTRKFWGSDGSADNQKKQYIGLGELYLNDERFTFMDKQPQPEFAQFMQRGMTHFAKTQLK